MVVWAHLTLGNEWALGIRRVRLDDDGACVIKRTHPSYCDLPHNNGLELDKWL